MLVLRTPKELYEKFWRMKVPKFKGSMDLIKVDNCMVDVHVILNFIKLIDQEKLLCSSFVLKNDTHL